MNTPRYSRLEGEFVIDFNVDNFPSWIKPCGYNWKKVFFPKGDTLMLKVWAREPYFRYFPITELPKEVQDIMGQVDRIVVTTDNYGDIQSSYIVLKRNCPIVLPILEDLLKIKTW